MFNNDAFINYDKRLIVQDDLENELLLVMAYLRLNASYDGYVSFTLNHIIKDMGYNLNRHEGGINQKVRNHLIWMTKCDWISPEINIEKATINDFIRLEINPDDESIFSIDKKTKFVQLNRSEYDDITKHKTKIDKAILLRVYLNIKKYINTNSNSKQEDRIAYPSMINIARDCGISLGGTLDNAIKDLVKLKLLYEHITGSYKDKRGNIKNANNVYALVPESLNDVHYKMLNYYKVEFFGKVVPPNAKSKKKPKIKTALDQIKENWDESIYGDYDDIV